MMRNNGIAQATRQVIRQDLILITRKLSYECLKCDCIADLHFAECNRHDMVYPGYAEIHRHKMSALF